MTGIPDFIANPGGAIAAYVELVSEVDDEETTKPRAKVTEAKEFTERTVAELFRQLLELFYRLYNHLVAFHLFYLS